MSNSSSLTIKRAIDRQALRQLVKFWSLIAEKEQNQLITEFDLLKLSKFNDKVNATQHLETEPFFY
ncbi:MAG: hypothetical protein AAGE96_06115 [Cyanobacteria bacterium P01_G01_bin.19]